MGLTISLFGSLRNSEFSVENTGRNDNAPGGAYTPFTFYGQDTAVRSNDGLGDQIVQHLADPNAVDHSHKRFLALIVHRNVIGCCCRSRRDKTVPSCNWATSLGERFTVMAEEVSRSAMLHRSLFPREEPLLAPIETAPVLAADLEFGPDRNPVTAMGKVAHSWQWMERNLS